MNDPIAAGDQAQHHLEAVIAPMLGGYFKALLAQGFEREEAMVLVADYHSALLPDGEDPD